MCPPQGAEEVQVPSKPQAGVQFGARGANGRVSLHPLSQLSLSRHYSTGKIDERAQRNEAVTH